MRTTPRTAACSRCCTKVTRDRSVPLLIRPFQPLLLLQSVFKLVSAFRNAESDPLTVAKKVGSCSPAPLHHVCRCWRASSDRTRARRLCAPWFRSARQKCSNTLPHRLLDTKPASKAFPAQNDHAWLQVSHLVRSTACLCWSRTRSMFAALAPPPAPRSSRRSPSPIVIRSPSLGALCLCLHCRLATFPHLSWDRLRAAGAIIVGKTNVHEMCTSSQVLRLLNFALAASRHRLGWLQQASRCGAQRVRSRALSRRQQRGLSQRSRSRHQSTVGRRRWLR